MAATDSTFESPPFEHRSMPGAIPIAKLHPLQRITASLVVRRRTGGPDVRSTAAAIGLLPPRKRNHLTSEEFEEQCGADPDDIAAVTAVVEHFGLSVTNMNAATRTISIEGTADLMSRTLGVEFAYYALGTHVWWGHPQPYVLPDELRDLVTCVVGLDNRPVVLRTPSLHPGNIDPVALLSARRDVATATTALGRTVRTASNDATTAAKEHPAVVELHRRIGDLDAAAADPRRVPSAGELSGVNAAVRDAFVGLAQVHREKISKLADDATDIAKELILAQLERVGVKTAPGVAELYDFPADTDGSGQCVAIIEFGGGYDLGSIEQYFSFLGLGTPKISDVSVAGGSNQPGRSSAMDIEVCLDIEVAGGAAPGAELVCYFGPLTGRGFVEAIQAAVHDRTHRPSVISVSWDLSEGYWMASPYLVDLMEEILAEAALLGITVICAAGDYGPPTTLHDGSAWVDYPASSPHVLGVGGTTLASSGSSIKDETVWNTSDTLGQVTGGGISRLFPVPAWQDDADLPNPLNVGQQPGRGVPDVAASGDPRTGYLVQVTGVGTTVVCGTSSGAPLWAALVARINQDLGVRVGYLNPLLYQLAEGSGAFRDVVSGDNAFRYGSSGVTSPGFRAREGWDAATGWGSPSGTALRDALAGGR